MSSRVLDVPSVRSDAPVLSAPLSGEFSRLSWDERRILESLACQVRAAQSLDEVMNHVFDTTRPISPCDRIGLAFLEEDGAHLVSRWVRADYRPVLLASDYAQDIAATSLGQVIEHGRPRVIDDLREYRRRRPQSRSTALLLREGVRSSMTCPLQVDGRNVGVLFRSSRRARAYDARQMQLHLAVADHVGLAVERAYRTDQLTAAKNAYLEILGFVSHELRGPLTAVSLIADNLGSHLLGELKAEQKVQVQRIHRNAQYMATMIQQYIDLARLDREDLRPWIDRDIDFCSAVLEPSVEMVKPQMDSKRMRILIEGRDARKRMECDSELLRVVIVNLLNNAVKYGTPEGLIEVRCRDVSGGFECAVRNEGPGFTAAEKSRLFRRFSRLHNRGALRERGSGLGLYNVWRVIRAHGGQVSARSEPGRWAEFFFRLPQPIPAACRKPAVVTAGELTRDAAAGAAGLMDQAQELVEKLASGDRRQKP